MKPELRVHSTLFVTFTYKKAIINLTFTSKQIEIKVKFYLVSNSNSLDEKIKKTIINFLKEFIL